MALLISAALLNFVAFFAKINAQFSRVGFVGGLIFAAVLLVTMRKVPDYPLRMRKG